MSPGYSIQLQDLHGDHGFDLAPLEAQAERVLTAEDVQPGAAVSILLVDEATIIQLNKQIFGRDYATDVIAQPLATPGDPDPLLGEVYISVDRALEEATRRSIPKGEELRRYLVHGLLHLLGYEDGNEAARAGMWARQEELILGP